MTSAMIHFDGSPLWPAAAIVDHWNGFAVPRVTVAVRDEIAAYLTGGDECDSADEIRATPADNDGLVTLRGWAFNEAQS